MDQRWVSSTRQMLSDFVVCLSTLRYAFTLILESPEHAIQALGSQSKSTSLLTQIRRWSSMLVSHAFLFRVYGMIDILDAESMVSKRLQSGTLNAHGLYDIMTGLPLMIESLIGKRGKAVQTYSGMLTSTGSDTKKFLSHTVGEKEYFVALVDYAITNPGLQDDYQVFCQELSIAIKSELVPSKQLKGFKHVFGWKGHNFSAIKQNPNYFVDSMKDIIAPYVKPQSDLLPEWVSDAAVVQAKSLQVMLTQSRPSGSDVGWESMVASMSNSDLWRQIRVYAEEDSNKCNLSVVLFLRKVSNIFDGSAAIIEQFNSSVTRILKDRQRGRSDDDNIEDILRCVYNGPTKEKFDPKAYLNSWTEVFKHKLVSTDTEKSARIATNAKKNARALQQYKSPEYQPKKLLKITHQKEKRNFMKEARAQGRGVVPGDCTSGVASIRECLVGSAQDWGGRVEALESQVDPSLIQTPEPGDGHADAPGSGEVTSLLYHIPTQHGVTSQHLVLFEGDTTPIWQLSSSLPEDMVTEFVDAQVTASSNCELCSQTESDMAVAEALHRHSVWHKRFDSYWENVDGKLKASKQWAAHEKEASKHTDEKKIVTSRNKAIRLFSNQTVNFCAVIMECWKKSGGQL